MRIMLLKTHLQTLKKGAMTISEYVVQMESVSDTLGLVGYTDSEDDLIMHLLQVLPAKYDATISSILTQTTRSFNFQEVKSLLLSQENRLEMWSATQTLKISNPSANFSQANQRSQGGNNNRGRGNDGHYNNRGCASNPGNSKPVCQICSKAGHTAVVCWYCNEDDVQEEASSPVNASQTKAAFLVTPKVVADPVWYVDSGATDHINADVQNL
ncbi:uncharacterized protein LOC133814572 [Humulus lupulus]|uniref:uncharacterized protein LOC133814572 n=1 Tax=Humulus lupulus TaxID=3486 RepID=UPI002B40C0B8|nr:uncharacterized protein LOC133814572 [Humulus lupulus]